MADENKEPISEIREAQRRAEKERKEAQAEAKAAAERMASLADQNRQMRSQLIATALERIGAPAGLASHFPESLEPTQENVEEFVKQTLGESWNAQAKPAPSANDERVREWERYEQNQPTGRPISNHSPLSEMHQRMLAENEAMTDPVARHNTRPTNEEIEQARADARILNRLNIEEGGAIMRGLKDPEVPQHGGFGGRNDPPPYALKVE